MGRFVSRASIFVGQGFGSDFGLAKRARSHAPVDFWFERLAISISCVVAAAPIMRDLRA